MRNARLDEAQAGIKIGRRNTSNLRYADNTTFMAEREEELKSLLMKVKEESKKASLKLNIQKTKCIEDPAVVYVESVLPMFSTRSLIVSGLTFRS